MLYIYIYIYMLYIYGIKFIDEICEKIAYYPENGIY